MGDDNNTRARVQQLLSEYSPTDPAHDFDAIKSAIQSTYSTLDALCRSLHASIVAEPLLLSLDFEAVQQDAERRGAVQELERWIGFVPETKPAFPREQWFKKWAEAALKSKNAKVLSKLVRVGQANLVANLRDWDPVEHAALWTQLITKELHPKFADTLLLGFLERKCRKEDGGDNRELLLTAFLGTKDNVSCEDWIASLLLNRRIINPEDLILLLMSMGSISSRFYERIVAVWADEAFVLTTNSQRHAQITAVVRFGLLRHKEVILQENLESLIVQGVSAHLSSNIAEKRNLGMIVGEDFSKLRDDDSTNQLDFGLDRDSIDDQYACYFKSIGSLPKTPVSTSPKPKSTEAADISTDTQVIRIDQITDLSSTLSWPWPVPPENLFTDGEHQHQDNEDDDACSLEPYDLTDDAMDGLVTVPKQLAQIPAMLTSDQYETVQTAMVHLADLIRINRFRQDTQRRAARLSWTLLELENKFGLADFDANRARALLSLVVCAPRAAGPAIARAIYSRELSIGVRLVGLSSLMDGAKLLAEGGFEEENDINAQDEAESTKQQLQGRDVLGTVTRRSKKLEQKPQKLGRKNLFAPVAFEFFFTPLCRRVAQFENEPILFCKIVQALGLFVEKAKHAGGEAERMAEDLLNLVPWMNSRKEAEIRRTAVFALLAVASVNKDYLASWQEWLIRTAQDDPDSVSRDLAKRILMAVG